MEDFTVNEDSFLLYCYLFGTVEIPLATDGHELERDVEIPLATDGHELERDIEAQELWEKVFEVLGEESGRIVKLKCEGYFFSEISRLMNLSYDRVYGLYGQGLVKLQNSLSDYATP